MKNLTEWAERVWGYRSNKKIIKGKSIKRERRISKTLKPTQPLQNETSILPPSGENYVHRDLLVNCLLKGGVRRRRRRKGSWKILSVATGNSLVESCFKTAILSPKQQFPSSSAATVKLSAENAGIRTPDLTRTALSEPEAGARNDSVGGMGDIAGKTMV